MPFLRNNVLTSYSPLIVPGYLFLMDIPGAKHFLLRILSVRGVVVSLSKIALQQLISMTSLWSLRTTPQVQLALRWPQLHAQCLTWTYMYRKKEHNIIWIDFTRLMDSDVFYRQKSEKKLLSTFELSLFPTLILLESWRGSSWFESYKSFYWWYDWFKQQWHQYNTI